MICCVGQVQFIWGLRGFNTYDLETQPAKLSNRGKHVIYISSQCHPNRLGRVQTQTFSIQIFCANVLYTII